MTLRVLILENREEDAALAVDHLKRAGFPVLEQRVDSKSGFERALASFSPALILSDGGLPQFTALDALKTTKALKPAVPFVIVTGSLDEAALVSCLGAGADDVVLKSNLPRLTKSVKEAPTSPQRRIATCRRSSPSPLAIHGASAIKSSVTGACATRRRRRLSRRHPVIARLASSTWRSVPCLVATP